MLAGRASVTNSVFAAALHLYLDEIMLYGMFGAVSWREAATVSPVSGVA